MPYESMDRGHIWTSRAFPASAQEPAILAAGVSKRVLYTDDFDAALKSLRKGDRLVVAGLRGLGRSRETILENMTRVHTKGCLVFDATTGKTGRHRDLLLSAAIKALSNEKRGPRKRTKKDIPWDVVRVYYFDDRLSNAEFEAKAKVGYHKARRYFGKPRGAQVGRPSAARLAMNATV